MSIFKLVDKKIVQLKETTFTNEKIDEVRDLQKFIINSIEIIERDLLVISSEFGDWEDSRRRIDILCIDKGANLVVIELKTTEDGGHMELQSIRYAAMISNLTFDKAVKAFQQYINIHNLSISDPEQEILNFLSWDEPNEEKFANDVRIILVSADFSREITTTVLWLIERDIDIKCIRIKPQKNGSDLFFDIQQIIPLPETKDYQVKLREKVAEQRQARKEGTRDYTRFDVEVGGEKEYNLNKRQTMHFVIKHCILNGISPSELMEVTNPSKWIWVDKECMSRSEFEAEKIQNTKAYDSTRWFNANDELFVVNGKTYAYSNQHGKATYDLVQELFKKFSQLHGMITPHEN